MSRAWPGWDGVVLLALSLVAAAVWAARDLAGLGPLVGLLFAGTLGWWATTHWLRNAEPIDDWKGASRGFTLGWRLYFTVLRYGGRRLVQWSLVPLVGFYWLFLRGPQRDGIDSYLARRLPHLSGRQRSLARFRLLLNFAWSLVDRFTILLRGTGGLVVDRSRVPGLQEKLYTGDDLSGLVILSGHLGNADFASAALNATGRRVHVLLHRAPTDPYFALMDEVMGEHAPRLVPLNDDGQVAALEALRALRANDIVALKGDRVADDRFVEVDFLGGRIRLPTGPFLLAALSGAPLLILGCFRIGDLHYRMEAVGPRVLRFTSPEQRDDDLRRWAQELADVLDEWTERYPLQWYNFVDPWAEARAGGSQ